MIAGLKLIIILNYISGFYNRIKLIGKNTEFSSRTVIIKAPESPINFTLNKTNKCN